MAGSSRPRRPRPKLRTPSSGNDAKKSKLLIQEGYLRSEPIIQALLTVPREEFIPPAYRDYAYLEVPLPLPGEQSTISCPHSYPLFYEPLGLDRGHRFLEIGTGSGYGAAVAREIVGPTGLVVTVEIDPLTYEFAKNNLARLGYTDVIVVLGDSGLGYPELAPYDRICFTAACHEVPPPWFEQLNQGGRLIGPIIEHGIQYLTLYEKRENELIRQRLDAVLYVKLRGTYGIRGTPSSTKKTEKPT